MFNIYVNADVSAVNFVRHGESTWNVEGRLQGQGEPKEGLLGNEEGVVFGLKGRALLDSSILTEEGQGQALELANKIFTWLGEKKRIVLVSSDLKRCRGTTEIVEKFLKFKSIETLVFYDERLREADHGILSGMLEAEYRQLECFKQYKTFTPEQQFTMAMDPEYGENYLSVAERVNKAVMQYRLQFPEDEIYFVTHGGPMRAIYTHLTGSIAPFSTEYDIAGQLKNCSIMKVQYNEDTKPTIEFK
ncbi:MAG: histidine phosphatase family protein [Chlamydiota bacterium]